jgi:predicted alpha/beta superfamily hydrolase
VPAGTKPVRSLVSKSNVVYQGAGTTEHLIRSRAVDQTFRIKVWEPIRTRGERFRVVYATDSDEFFDGLATLANSLQLHGETPRFVLVGIGYENSRAAGLLRMRDFWPHGIRRLYARELIELANSPLLEGITDLKVITETTDATQFLSFIRDELMPFIAGKYPTQERDNTYFGYSAGAGFGLYSLFTQPDTFKRYVLGSPATSYGGHQFAVELVSTALRAGLPMEAQVFMSVGELEEFSRGLSQLDLASGYFQLAKFLRNLAVPGLSLSFKMFPGETHATAWSPAFSTGLRTLLGPVEDVPVWPDYFRRNSSAPT